MNASVNGQPSASSDDDAVTVTRHNGVAVVTLDRADKLNALDPTVVDQLDAALVAVGRDAGVQVVILTGAGRGFCSGADVSLLTSVAESGTALATMRYLCRPVLTLSRLPQVTIAAVNGAAIGAGWGLAMGCDIRIASTSACFGATFVRMGLGPDYGLSQSLPRAIGRGRALQLLLTGRIISATEAQAIGVASIVAENAVTEALQLAETIAAVPARAIRSTKETLRRAEDASIDVVLTEIEAGAQAALFNHPDFLSDAAAWIARHGGTGK